jgi:colanic acid/amylovoran biosynthesis glycosyltransferase
MRQLFYFTSSFPYGLGERWKANELDVLCSHFSRIFLLPFSYAGNFDKPVTLPGNATSFLPLQKNSSNAKKHILKMVLSPRLGYYLKEAFSKKVLKKRKWLIGWAVACIQTEICLRSIQFKTAIQNASKEDIWYFYWGFEWAYVIPFLEKKGFKNIFFRVHGPDLYEERDGNSGYIPFRQPLFELSKAVIVLSQQSKDYVVTKGCSPEKILISPLGTVTMGKPSLVVNKMLELVSCSRIVEVKRLWLIAKALWFADIPVRWTHIGHGPLYPQLQQEVRGLPSNVTVKFTGQLSPLEVRDYYCDNFFDLFLNVSSSEGMPVAIMEAFAAGIPVMATAVGGVPEMIDENNGVLLKEDITAEELWQKIKQFQLYPQEVKLAKRLAAFSTYEKKYQAYENADRLAKQLIARLNEFETRPHSLR